ncbi:MAG: pyridoxamine 5'-phosphate oxidase family protein [candidate division WOR-3 bacterium]|nr:pyridoxamine 5'-phosphate oxidase family protein [candidate division WOR-3 bacterium]MDH5683607.1 pyridoxamine 5'-phosphate oxidase family protein [candidate division WOR-3 bacterium]
MSSSDVQKIVSIMKQNSMHAYFATVDGDLPQVRPVSPIVEDDMSIWVTTFSNSRKVKQLKQNPKCCLAFVEQPDGNKAAIVTGKAQIISNLTEKKRVWDFANFNLSEYFPKGPECDEFCLLKINIDKVEWRDSWEGGRKVYEPTE